MFLLEEFKVILDHYEQLKAQNKIIFDYLHLEYGIGQMV